MVGVDLRTVAELLGHRTLQMVMRYLHLAPEHQASAVDRLVTFRGHSGHLNGHQSVFKKSTQIGPNIKLLKKATYARRGGRARLNAPDSKCEFPPSASLRTLPHGFAYPIQIN
jgi:hypothetical protein